MSAPPEIDAPRFNDVLPGGIAELKDDNKDATPAADVHAGSVQVSCTLDGVDTDPLDSKDYAELKRVIDARGGVTLRDDKMGWHFYPTSPTPDIMCYVRSFRGCFHVTVQHNYNGAWAFCVLVAETIEQVVNLLDRPRHLFKSCQRTAEEISAMHELLMTKCPYPDMTVHRISSNETHLHRGLPLECDVLVVGGLYVMFTENGAFPIEHQYVEGPGGQKCELTDEQAAAQVFCEWCANEREYLMKNYSNIRKK